MADSTEIQADWKKARCCIDFMSKTRIQIIRIKIITFT